MAISYSSKRVKQNKSDLSQKTSNPKLAALGIRPAKFSPDSLRCFIRRLSIAKKIAYGYSLAIGIAVMGTTVGLVTGDYYQRQATKQLKSIDEQQQLLRNLGNSAVVMRSHPQRLVSILGKTILFQYESVKFLGEVDRFKENIKKLESFADDRTNNLAADAKEFKEVLKGYETNAELYVQLMKGIWHSTDPANLKNEEIAAARQQVFEAISSQIATEIDFQFERLTENLNRFIAAAQTQQQRVNIKRDEAEALRLQIIAASTVLSAAIAVALAHHTSRAIAKPIEWVTQVAQKVTEEANFKLIAPVTTEDEVGTLATSLNQLVKWVGEYTQEIDSARQTLEQRVDERTRELQQALENLKQTQSQLIQTEKMSSLGQMVAGVAHEINNPVNFIYGNLQHTKNYAEDLLQLVALYQQHYPNPNSEIQEYIEAIDLEFLGSDLPKLISSMKMGSERIRQIVLSLRNFSRLDEAEMKAVDIHEGIDSTLLILNNRLKQGIEVIKNYDNLPFVRCYPAQLNQVFMNILANAIDALESEKRQSKKQITIETSIVNYNQIKVTIRDNGPGIPPQIQSKLFDPFFTTKEPGKGTGLGLSISYQIIEKHKGKIEISSEPGRGTEFAIVLPVEVVTSMAA